MPFDGVCVCVFVCLASRILRTSSFTIHSAQCSAHNVSLNVKNIVDILSACFFLRRFHSNLDILKINDKIAASPTTIYVHKI